MTSAADVLELFGLDPAQRSAPPLGPAAGALLAVLAERPASGDELLRAAGVEPGVGGSALLELELAGRIAHEDGVYRATI